MTSYNTSSQTDAASKLFHQGEGDNNLSKSVGVGGVTER